MNLAVVLAAELIVLPTPRPVAHVLQTLAEERATVFPGVPTTYVAVINHPDVAQYDLRSIKACISGRGALAGGGADPVRADHRRHTGGRVWADRGGAGDALQSPAGTAQGRLDRVAAARCGGADR